MSFSFTTKMVEGFKATDKRQYISDARTPNLVLAIQPSGSKSWQWAGRIDGKMARHTLGQFPVHSLDDARKWANEITEARDNGIDLIAQRKLEAEAEEKAKAEEEKAIAEDQSRTCEWLFNLYMEKEGNGGKASTVREKWRVWHRDIKPHIGAHLVSEVTRADLAKIIRDRHAVAPIASNTMVALIKRWWRWAVTKGQDLTGLEIDPAANLVKLEETRDRKRHLDDYEIGLFFKAVDEVGSVMREPLILILYTGVRRNEAFGADWTEFKQLHKGYWIIPENRTKNGLEHLVPLPAIMQQMMHDIRRRTNRDGLVWPTSVCLDDEEEEDRPMSGFSNIMDDLNAKVQELAKKDKVKVERFTIHDLRRTLSSGMNGMLDKDDNPIIPSDIVERCINHKLGGVRGVYNRHEYVKEKRRAFRIWADHLNKLRGLPVEVPANDAEEKEEDEAQAA